MKNKIIQLKTSHNSLAQYIRPNSIVMNGIPSSLEDDNLENTIVSILSDADMKINPREIEACHRFGKSVHRKIVMEISLANSYGNRFDFFLLSCYQLNFY